MADYSTLSESALVTLLKQGEAAAYKEIFGRYDKLLYSFAYRKLREREEAKDVVQEVFVWLWTHREKLEPEVNLSAFLYKSVLNKIFDIFRHQSIIQKWVAAGNHYIDVADSATDYLIREKDIRAIIQKEIDQLPPRMREIYELKRNQYLSVKEIAQQLDISEHTVATQLKRAMRQLRLRLGMVIYVLYIIGHLKK